MRKNALSLILLIALAFSSCSDPNAPYTDKIAAFLKKQANGVEIQYKSKSFEFVDTLYAHEKASDLQIEYNERLKGLLSKVETIRDEYLTLEKLKKLRNQEQEMRANPDYYKKVIFSGDCDSDWCEKLKKQLASTDRLISNFDNLPKNDLSLKQNAVWYYKRHAKYYNQSERFSNLEMIEEGLNRLISIQATSDSLTALGNQHKLHIKALNEYQIVNPMLDKKQDLKFYFLFDPKTMQIFDQVADSTEK